MKDNEITQKKVEDVKEKEVEKVVEVKEEDLPPHLNVKPDPIKKTKALGTTTGVVINCTAVRLRSGANLRTSEMAQIPSGTTVKINLDNSTETFYEVTIEVKSELLVGFCVKDFISLG
jgi:uncharacterized protein YgiM (DUF1202 family)